MKDVPVLITYDIHVGTHAAGDVARYLGTVLGEHARFGIPASFHFPAAAAREMVPTVRELVKYGHAIGNHSLTHGPGEVYDRMSPDAQEDALRRATRELEDVTQQPVRFFRAPVFRMNGATIRALERLGYEAELSMNSQRLGLLSSDPWNVTWMAAPRGPYHPDTERPWRRGTARLWEIPLSCWLLPFMSNTLLMFRVEFMKLFFRALYAESRLSGRPIVYMTHPEEFHAARPAVPRHVFRWTDLLPSTYGFSFRHALMQTDPEIIARESRELFEYMRTFPGIRFLTVPELVRRLNGTPAPECVEELIARPGG